MNNITTLLMETIAQNYIGLLKEHINGKHFYYDIYKTKNNMYSSYSNEVPTIVIEAKRKKERPRGQEEWKYIDERKPYTLLNISYYTNNRSGEASNTRTFYFDLYRPDKIQFSTRWPMFSKNSFQVLVNMFNMVDKKNIVIYQKEKQIKIKQIETMLPIFLTVDQLAEPENLAEII